MHIKVYGVPEEILKGMIDVVPGDNAIAHCKTRVAEGRIPILTSSRQRTSKIVEESVMTKHRRLIELQRGTRA